MNERGQKEAKLITSTPYQLTIIFYSSSVSATTLNAYKSNNTNQVLSHRVTYLANNNAFTFFLKQNGLGCFNCNIKVVENT